MFKNIQIHQVLIALLIGVAVGAWGIQVRDYGCWMKKPCKGELRQHMIKKMERDLALDATQKKQVETIFETMRPRMKALRMEMRPKFEMLREETRTEVRKVLKPDQLPKFDELNKKMDARWAKYRAKRDAARE